MVASKSGGEHKRGGRDRVCFEPDGPPAAVAPPSKKLVQVEACSSRLAWKSPPPSCSSRVGGRPAVQATMYLHHPLLQIFAVRPSALQFADLPT